MKVLSNLLGDDTKIKANVIALKDTDNNVYTLDNFLEAKSLWTNSSPTSDFAAQTLTFNATDYNLFLIIYKTGNIYDSKIIKKGIRFSIDGINAARIYARNSGNDGISDSGVTFGNGIYIGSYGTESQSNGTAIPIEIIGLHLNLS